MSSPVMFVHSTQAIKIFGNMCMPLVPYPSVNNQTIFYGDHPRGTPPTGGGG